KLAGINTTRGSGTTGFTSNFAVSTQDYESWITQTVPEPASAMLLIGVGALLGVAHRIRCMLE
ncbi:MAG TPA: PEP-CTERM sorting domain-containing protein, partial [Tichowtungia sp.]|nr:PEP-CTERM sorting domain-containing protein [Tichowtungia sp.]